MLKTAFWQNAARSLHPSVRARHIGDLQRAENLELALDAALQGCARARGAFARMFEPRRPSHGHR
jgi:hypothetical protein